MVKIISWNYHGVAKYNFHNSAMDLKCTHNPTIMLIVETKLSGEVAQSQSASLEFAKSCFVNSDGFIGGLWLYGMILQFRWTLSLITIKPSI
ncbi:hypothetical protein SLA2020_063220 [Shorea laevis]